MIYPWLVAAQAEFTERLGQARLPHALLVSGPKGTGKTVLASGFAASALCLEQSSPACGACRSCELLSSGAHPDRRIITFEEHPRTGELRTEIVIDQVRDLIGSLNLTNTISQRKAALIHPAEAMNRNAANALLKTLEEPPGESFLVLVSHDLARLPATIRSRCQAVNVRLPAPAVAMEWLCAENGLDQAEAETALQAAAGSPLGALSMVREGTTSQFRLLQQTLNDLQQGRIGSGAALATLSDIEPDSLWSWLSLLTATRVKACLHRQGLARKLSDLQFVADRNRKLLASPVRKDFLLQDWLIQWAALSA